MNFETLTYIEENGILHVKLNRPERRNAVNGQMIKDVGTCFSEVATKDSVKVVLFSGEGKAFCAGTDLTEIGNLGGATPEAVRRFAREGQRAFNQMELLEKVVIALIHGYAIGAGMEMILACDMRICSEEAYFSIPEVAVGILPDLGGSQRLPRMVGVGRAKELILTAKTVSAIDAEKMGLINKVVPATELVKTGIEWARQVMENFGPAVGLAKRNIDIGFSQSIAEGAESSGTYQSMLFSHPEAKNWVETRASKTIGKKHL